MRKTRHTDTGSSGRSPGAERDTQVGERTDRQTDSIETKLQEEDAGRERPGDPGEPSGWGSTANVRDILGGLSENQNQTVTMQYSELERTLGLTQSTCSFQAEDTQAQKVTLVF